jgi:predicted RNA-binding protein with PUA-like domain
MEAIQQPGSATRIRRAIRRPPVIDERLGSCVRDVLQSLRIGTHGSVRWMQADRKYWVWVTGPDYYLDEDGKDRRDLDPGRGYEVGGWWTCHKLTQVGDLVLMYRSQVKRDLAYLIETRSDAYSILDDDFAAQQRWDYGCDYEVIERFEAPMTLEEMRSDQALSEWGALRAGFRRRVYAIPPDVWDHLLERLSVSRAQTENRRRAAQRRYTFEREIEETLAREPERFAPHGLQLALRAKQHPFPRGGRADLVFYDRNQRCFVVVELKRDLVGRIAVAQLLSYRASVREEFRARKRPIGILVGGRLDNEAAGMIDDDHRLRFLGLDRLGFRS